MNWISLTNELEAANLKSSESFAIIYKHSTRCMTSLMAFRRLKSESLKGYDGPFYIVDVIKDRSVSRAVADLFGVGHESPQLLLIQNGRCIYNASHEDVSLQPLLAYL
jgi:bacillithiol system protein YtxJ